MHSDSQRLVDVEIGTMLVRQAIQDMSESWFADKADLSTHVLPKKLIELAKSDRRGRHFLEKLILEHSFIGAEGIFTSPLGYVEDDNSAGISRQSMMQWLTNPLKAMEPSLIRIGAGVIAPVIRDQIGRQAVVFWRDLLGDSLYTETLSRRREVNLVDLKGWFDASTYRRLIDLCQYNSDSKVNAEFIRQGLVYLGAQEIWSYLHRYMPDLKERMMLLIPPQYFHKRYKSQFSDAQLEELLQPALVGPTEVQRGCDSEDVDRPDFSNPREN